MERQRGLLRFRLRPLGLLLLGVILLLLGAAAVHVWHLDQAIRAQFEGRRWALPTRVYARPLELYVGQPLTPVGFEAELAALRYRPTPQVSEPGTYRRDGNVFDVSTRPFLFWDGPEPSRTVRIAFTGGAVSALVAYPDEKDVPLLRMDPVAIAGIYPAHGEDRVLVKLEDWPPLLPAALMAVEDRNFFEHSGIDPRGILRALWANLRAGRTVQGGSTLTQQLVKNYFLSNERTVKRKLNEMAMAVLLESHYSKQQILEAYGNEVYLGQDGQRAIHGFGLASRFYFDRSLKDLKAHHVALLVGLVRGPSQYDPRRHPERALQRRNLVLRVMAEQGLLSAEEFEQARAEPLDVSPSPPSGVTPYPAFLDLVRLQLRQDYREEDLRSEGLQVFTTLDPLVQGALEGAVKTVLPALEDRPALRDASLQASAVFVDPQSGEVLAMLGGRNPGEAGFNRAMNAARPIGSLVKPAIYLCALEHPERYTLATPLDDTPLVYRPRYGADWQPENYDKRFRGEVLLWDALVHSYNVPTARVGLDLGVEEVAQTLHRLGVARDLKPYPSLLLGAVELTPFDVAEMYETLASGGFRTPLRAIREVVAADGAPLQHYPLQVEQVVAAGPEFLITSVLQGVVREGTARSLRRWVAEGRQLAGKTGTTDDLRDSWFVAFSSNLLGVVWVGRDDNGSTGLSGSTGALRVWGETVRSLDLSPLERPVPGSIEYAVIDPETGLQADQTCRGAMRLPFLRGSVPAQSAPCVTPWRIPNAERASAETY